MLVMAYRLLGELDLRRVDAQTPEQERLDAAVAAVDARIPELQAYQSWHISYGILVMAY